MPNAGYLSKTEFYLPNSHGSWEAHDRGTGTHSAADESYKLHHNMA
jgi:hypothetical protein